MARHVLYRFFDSRNRLLYVGITKNPGERWNGHSSSKPWWEDVAKIMLEHYPDEEACREAERGAILAENPLYNKQRARPREPIPDRFVEFGDGTYIDLNAQNPKRWRYGYMVDVPGEEIPDPNTGRMLRVGMPTV